MQRSGFEFHIRPLLLKLIVLSAFLPLMSAADGQGTTRRSQQDADNENEPGTQLKEAGRFRQVGRSRPSSEDALVQLCQETVNVTSRRLLSTDQHTPWQMIHALLGLRNDFSLMHEGQPVNGLDWIAEGQVFRNEYWFEKTKFGGRAHPYSVPYAFEGHANQTVALLSMCGVPLDREFGTGAGTITMRDMIRHAQMTVTAKDEPTWTLWALSRYLPPTEKWRNMYGEYWSIEKLVQLQTSKPERGSPCGATHGLFALAHARNVYMARNGIKDARRLRGVWASANGKINRYIEQARRLQHSNGSLGHNYFRDRSVKADFNKRMASVGHVLEFLMISLPQDRLKERWVRRAIESAANELMNNRKAYVKCSPLYHTINAINIYLDRVNPKVDKIAKAPESRTVDTKDTSVVATTISKSRKLPPEATEPAEAAAPAAVPAEPVVEITKDSPIADAPHKVQMEETKTAALPEEAPAADELLVELQPAVTDDGKWKSTPAERRKPIIIRNTEIGGAGPLPATSATVTPGAAKPREASPATTNVLIPVDEVDNGSTADQAMVPAPKLAPAEVSEPAVAPAPTVSVMPTPTVSESPATSDVIEAPTTVLETPAAEVPAPAPATAPKVAPAPSKESTPAAEPAKEAEKSVSVTAPPLRDLTASLAVSAAPSEVLAGQLMETDAQPEPIDAEIARAQVRFPNRDLPATGINSDFLKEDVDARRWRNEFEALDREICGSRNAIVAALNLSPGHRVADVGCGTGLFIKPLAEQVGDTGRVYAIDISPRFVEYVEQRADDQGLLNVIAVRNDDQSLMLQRNKVDRVLLCDSYHCFEQPHEMLKSIFGSLNPNGEVVLVESTREPGLSPESVMERVRADKDTFREELTRAGFEFIEELTPPGLKAHYVLRFRRPSR